MTDAPIPQADDRQPVRFSHLRACGRSAMHGHHARLVEAEPNAAMERGTAVHALLFGNRKVCGYPGSQRRGKDFDAFVVEHPDHEILTGAEYQKAQRMADAVRECKLAQPMLQGVIEETILFPWMGLECRATPDIRGTDYITELKTSATSDPLRFGWHALRMHYHAQMCMQTIACATGKRITAKHCYIVCVESTEPYPVTVFQLTDRALLEGNKLLMLWAERFKNCELSGVWSAYADCIVPLDVADDLQLEYDDD